MKPKIIIFTDLDGTLLDRSYSFKKALPALKLIEKHKIPLILCSSKTRAEIEYYRRKLKNTDPFVSENGGGIFIPKNYFRGQVEATLREDSLRESGVGDQAVTNKKYTIIKLGEPYSVLRKALVKLRSDGFDVRGFGDMSTKEVAALTGLKTTEAKMAKQRDFDEPFTFNGTITSLNKLKQNIRSIGLTCTQGEFFHIKGDINKGRAVSILYKLYSKQYIRIHTIALGDNPNDIEMFRKVDYPVLVKKHNGSYNKKIRVKGLIRAGGIGPDGWNKAVINLLRKLI